MMITVSETLYPEHYASLKNLARSLEEAPPDALTSQINEYFQTHARFLQSAEGTLSLFFLDAMNKRLSGDSNRIKNLYLLPDEGQQIKMFNFMALKFPLVRIAQDILNHQYRQAVEAGGDFTILDIGMGTGQQIARLIRLLGETRFTGKITVIGIEPSEDSVNTAAAALASEARQYRMDFEMVRFVKTVEDLTEAEWTAIEKAIQGPLLVNASFALHHIRPTKRRTELFQRLREFNPDVVGLIEPYADFLTANLQERFANAWHHYGLTFKAIDQIEATDAEKRDLKTVFFSREIQDVLSQDELRVEQFETGEMWAGRLTEAGFETEFSPKALLETESCPFVSIVRKEGYIGLAVDQHPIISIVTGR